MSKLILWFACAVALIFGVWALMDNPGTVQVTWLGYVMETSVAFCLGLIACFMLIIYLVLFPRRWLRWIRKKLETKRSVKTNEMLIQILTNILCKVIAA